jgi:hypothetical protein
MNEFGFVPFSFIVSVTNEAPTFSDNSLKNKIVPFGSEEKYSLPNVIDREKQQVRYIVSEENKNSLHSFIKFDEKIGTFTISPT